MEREDLVNLLNEYGGKIETAVLMDFGDEFDEDDEAYPITGNVVELIDDNIVIYNTCDNEPLFNYDELSDDFKKEVDFAVNFTIKNF